MNFLNIIATGLEGSSSAQIQAGGVTYSASTSSTGIGDEGAGLVIWIPTPTTSSFLWNTYDAFPFESGGQSLTAVSGQAYCVKNSSSATVRFTINTGTGSLSVPASNPSPILLQPGQSTSFVFDSTASNSHPIPLQIGCPPPLTPLNPQPMPLQPSSLLTKIEDWIRANKGLSIGVAAGIAVLVVFLIGIALSKKNTQPK